ncbi:phage lytic cycle repressor MrpR family protein [Bacillus sp. Marseille-P3800]|uniref:phage lytic cycle repressor MrpR family protein n=1 Tax=Bacillus sp. Marseille-P3800 TaxID=2014782 RepID=UPI000C0747CC|nr:hypothetical protein [Bacillus sp. Marseille-P3800]
MQPTVYQENKNNFIESRNISAVETYARSLNALSEVEIAKGKDLYDFNIDEIKEAILNKEYTSRTTVLSITNIMKNYINWAIETKLKSESVNPLVELPNDFLNELIDDTRRTLVSEDELAFVEDTVCENAQDAVISRLIFEGVCGKDFAELLNLKYDDMDKSTNTLLLTDFDGSKRTIKISYRLIVMIDRAHAQERYETDAYWDNTHHTFMVESPYVLKNIKWRQQATGDLRVKGHTVRKRLNKFRDNGFKFMTRKTLQKSGMLYKAKELLQRDGELSKKQWDIIASTYNFKLFTQPSGQQYYAINEYKRDINVEKIREVYNPERKLGKTFN